MHGKFFHHDCAQWRYNWWDCISMEEGGSLFATTKVSESESIEAAVSYRSWNLNVAKS